ncbi:sulfatase-like hydrolase/transferase [Metabacillus fastidiosus]|uniref:sulfatase-like hydrolase/transferase n=1 Tax=Metabacillus fastidiosus TaxID=1458 RepID=UPI002E23B43E|nr:sulfatase-like hydrolase/transferase [Metabacillus fastidiosus]MED4455133.1 sulfatase-like hydrolase/transferase [Metabacillus fastidiosus]
MTGSNQKPNVIVFFTDQQRWDTTGVHGNPLNLTPNFDRMAKDGTHVSKSFTCQPVCAPARSSLQTGLYATETGVYRNSIPLSKNSKTLAHYFKEYGYYTGYIGKWHLAESEPVKEEERGGYEYWLASNLLEFSSDSYDTVLYNNENEAVKLPGYRVDAITDQAIQYINQHQDSPFYLFLSYIEPHHQNHLDNYPAPDGYEERYIGRWLPPDLAALGGTAHQHIAGYYGMVKKLDEALGRLLDALKSLHLSENTIVLFTSDHGNHFKTRNSEYKRSCHDSSIRVPTAIVGPAFNGGGKIDHLVSLVDLPPTLLDGAGIPVPEKMQGNSLLSLLKREDGDWQDDVFIQISESQVGRAIRTERWKYGVTAEDKDGWDDSASNVYTEEYLYDLYADPYELTNLIGLESYETIISELKERLLRRISEVEGDSSVIKQVERKSSGQRKVSVR